MRQRRGRAGLDAAARREPETLGYRAIERHPDAHIEPAADESEPQRLAGLLGNLYAQSTQDALARVIDDIVVGP